MDTQPARPNRNSLRDSFEGLVALEINFDLPFGSFQQTTLSLRVSHVTYEWVISHVHEPCHICMFKINGIAKWKWLCWPFGPHVRAIIRKGKRERTFWVSVLPTRAVITFVGVFHFQCFLLLLLRLFFINVPSPWWELVWSAMSHSRSAHSPPQALWFGEMARLCVTVCESVIWCWLCTVKAWGFIFFSGKQASSYFLLRCHRGQASEFVFQAYRTWVQTQSGAHEHTQDDIRFWIYKLSLIHFEQTPESRCLYKFIIRN